MESLGTGRKGAQRGAKGQKEASPLAVRVPSGSIAGPAKKGKKSLAGGKLGSFTFLPFYL